MLDFYILKDDQAKPNYPEHAALKFAGEIDDVTFSNLQNKGIIDSRFGYYSDFRWETAVITQIRKNILQKEMQNDTDVQQLIQILETADTEQSGLIAYGD
ncbi:hypothetical protein M2347_000477 [Chryseobacterium sp. H1D6B]|uniref:hypothetical protein n=1 Tax=Chryseobacterium sp. H1D6B TaxID=2940588 RepID=UPI0015CBA3B9|nr:hypothetical protein [Chryseobacterium sp. H1D6B]MDH6250750.1 hypothetical protein [Chryseobacterium sp. H1D6B]